MAPPLQKLQHDLASVTLADLRRITARVLGKLPQKRCGDAILRVTIGKAAVETMPLQHRQVVRETDLRLPCYPCRYLRPIRIAEHSANPLPRVSRQYCVECAPFP